MCNIVYLRNSVKVNFVLETLEDRRDRHRVRHTASSELQSHSWDTFGDRTFDKTEQRAAHSLSGGKPDLGSAESFG
jgi:hypothetical protein